jgi:hypothetical protein
MISWIPCLGGCSLAELYSSTDSSRSKTINYAASYGDSKSLPRNLNVDARQTIPSPLLSALDSSFSLETRKPLGQRVRWLWQRARPPERCSGEFQMRRELLPPSSQLGASSRLVFLHRLAVLSSLLPRVIFATD